MNQLPKPSADLAALGSAALLAAAGDYLFWRATPGISLGIFVTLCALALVLNTRHRWNESTFIICALLIASAVQTGIEGSFSNLVALLGLICVLTGETTVEGVRGLWARWSEAIWNFLKPISGWLWFASIARQVPVEPRLIHRVGDVSLRVLFPALGLGLVFTLLLGSGNAVFGHWSAEGFNSIVSILTHLDFSIGRAFLWLFLGTFALTLLRPKIAPTVARIWTRRIPELPLPANPVIAKWRSLAVLALLNFLFFVANTADALYLWTSARLPEGVSYSEFVHNGVWSLSAAVVLSAIVLTAIFQQNAAIRAAKSLRVLSLIWIAQNLILISGVFLRLVRYVEAYQLSELRVYVGCFLLLVTIGFGSLTLHIFVRRA